MSDLHEVYLDALRAEGRVLVKGWRGRRDFARARRLSREEVRARNRRIHELHVRGASRAELAGQFGLKPETIRWILGDWIAINRRSE